MTIPTLNELRQSIYADLRNRIGLTSVIGKVALGAFALVHAAKQKLFYLQLAKVYKNIFPDKADSELLGGTLERFGIIKLGRYPNPAIAGEYVVNVTGSIAATIPLGTTFKSTDSSTNPNYTFVLDTLYTFTATTGQITVRALTAGTESELEIDDQLQLTQPIANVGSFATVSSIATYADDAEDIEDYRKAVIQSFQVEPQGGSRGDIRLWAQDASYVRQVYPVVETAGILTVYVESSLGNGIAEQSILDDVHAVINYDPDTSKPVEERSRMPVGVWYDEVFSVSTLEVNIIIYNLTDTSYLSAITTAIESFIYDVRPYIDGADDPRDQDKGTLYAVDIYNVVRGVLQGNATFSSITMQIAGGVTPARALQTSEIFELNSVTNA